MGISFKKKIFLRLVFILQWLIFLSCSKKYLGNKVDEKPSVILFWHGRLALMPFAFRHFKMKNKKAYVMISHHKDGENIARLIKFYGLDTIRGSTFKGGSMVLKAAFKVLEENNDVIITPDGPRGPYHSISDGVVILAHKKNVKIRILNYEANRFWEFKSWDKMILPKPFSKIIYSLSEPLDIGHLNRNDAKDFLKQNFEKIYKRDSFKDKKMMTFFKKIIPQIFIAIALEEKNNVVKICTYRNKTRIETQKKTFKEIEHLINYIKNYDKKIYPYRIALFLNSVEQGVIPNLSQNYESFGIDKARVKILTLNNAQLYTQMNNIEYFDKKFEKCGGLDFIFSPFALLYYLVQKENNNKITLFVYKYSRNLCLMICKGKEILIGDFKIFQEKLDIESEPLDNGTLDNEPHSSQDKDEIENSNSDEENLSNEDKSSNDENDISASNNAENDKQNTNLQDVKMDIKELKQFSENMEICHYIIASIEKFYNDKHYSGDFIDGLIIFTHEKMIDSAIDFLENEIFIKPQVRNMDNFDLIIKIMQKELNFEL